MPSSRSGLISDDEGDETEGMDQNDSASSGLADLSRVLWRIQRHLQRLRYQLTMQDLLLDNDDGNLLQLAVGDVESTIRMITQAEAERAQIVSRVSPSIGLQANATLLQLAQNSPPPFDKILLDHRSAFLEITTTIASMSVGARDRVNRGLNVTSQMLGVISGAADDGGYNSSGDVERSQSPNLMFDGSL